MSMDDVGLSGKQAQNGEDQGGEDGGGRHRDDPGGGDGRGMGPVHQAAALG